jgi:predicted Rossmann fold nucleotide-binding protein DprA/Smf involved in DNA uptake
MRDGARMIRGSGDLLEDLRWEPVSPAASTPTAATPDPGDHGLSANEGDVWRALGAPLTPDQVGALTAMPVPAVLSALARLEIRGLVREVGGRYERRVLTPRP